LFEVFLADLCHIVIDLMVSLSNNAVALITNYCTNEPYKSQTLNTRRQGK